MKGARCDLTPNNELIELVWEYLPDQYELEARDNDAIIRLIAAIEDWRANNPRPATRANFLRGFLE